MNRMKCLVTGGAGFIGSNLAIQLEKLDHDVTVIDNFISGHPNNLTGFGGKILKGDENTISDINNSFDVVFHQAAITDTTVDDQEKMFKNNVEGFKHILNFCENKECRLVYASSAAVYGLGKVQMKEDQELKPLNIYGRSKFEMDRIAERYCDKIKTMVGLRYFNVFGPREHFKGKMASMIYKLALQIKAGRMPRIFKYGEQSRDHVYVKDVVDANVKSMSYDGFDIFNVGTGIETNFNELIYYLNDALCTDSKPEYFDNPYIGSYQNNTLADMSKTQERLGFKAKYTVAEGIEDYFRWLDGMGWYNE